MLSAFSVTSSSSMSASLVFSSTCPYAFSYAAILLRTLASPGQMSSLSSQMSTSARCNHTDEAWRRASSGMRTERHHYSETASVGMRSRRRRHGGKTSEWAARRHGKQGGAKGCTCGHAPSGWSSK